MKVISVALMLVSAAAHKHHHHHHNRASPKQAFDRLSNITSARDTPANPGPDADTHITYSGGSSAGALSQLQSRDSSGPYSEGNAFPTPFELNWRDQKHPTTQPQQDNQYRNFKPIPAQTQPYPNTYATEKAAAFAQVNANDSSGPYSEGNAFPTPFELNWRDQKHPTTQPQQDNQYRNFKPIPAQTQPYPNTYATEKAAAFAQVEALSQLQSRDSSGPYSEGNAFPTGFELNWRDQKHPTTQPQQDNQYRNFKPIPAQTQPYPNTYATEKAAAF